MKACERPARRTVDSDCGHNLPELDDRRREHMKSHWVLVAHAEPLEGILEEGHVWRDGATEDAIVLDEQLVQWGEAIRPSLLSGQERASSIVRTRTAVRRDDRKEAEAS